MKALVKHSITCTVRASGGCRICRHFWALLQVRTQLACTLLYPLRLLKVFTNVFNPVFWFVTGRFTQGSAETNNALCQDAETSRNT